MVHYGDVGPQHLVFLVTCHTVLASFMETDLFFQHRTVVKIVTFKTLLIRSASPWFMAGSAVLNILMEKAQRPGLRSIIVKE